MQESSIRWTKVTWNAIHGCSKVSNGCKHCYAMTLSLKNGWTKTDWTVPNESDNVMMKPHKLHEPYLLKTPSRVFVNSMSDMFHRTIPDWYRAVMWAVMLDTPQHTYQILTKRAEDLPEWDARFIKAQQTPEYKDFASKAPNKVKRAMATFYPTAWADHIWQGVSVEDERVLPRIKSLQQCGAKVRFISAEPLLGAWGDAVDLTGIHWVIVGGESGNHMGRQDDKDKNPRWMRQEWAREIKNHCVAQQVAYFYKQDSAHVTEMRPYLLEEDGTKWVWEQYPNDLTPPRRYGHDSEVVFGADETQVTAEMARKLAIRAEHLAYKAEGYMAENYAVASAYWYAKSFSPVKHYAPLISKLPTFVPVPQESHQLAMFAF